MIIEIFGYAILVALLVGLAAASAECLLTEIQKPRRFAWLGAYATALAFPPLLWLLADDPPAFPSASVIVAPRESLAMLALIDWDTTLLWLWVITTAVLAMLYAAAWCRLALLAKRWPRETSDGTSIIVTDDLGPAVLGVLRPRIALPRWLMDAPAAMRTTVVAHEREHIAARDQACIVAAQVITLLLPWNLPLWWFLRQLRASIEIDCDARVLRRYADPAEYADVLLAVGQRRSASPYAAATLIDPARQLERRIRIILTIRSAASKVRASVAAVAAVALAACITQLDPPATVAGTPPVSNVATEASVVTLNAGSVIENSESRVTVRAADIRVRVAETGQMRIISESAVATNDGMVFEGDVRIDSDSTSIRASRAVASTSRDGQMILTVENAKVIRTFAAPTLAE